MVPGRIGKPFWLDLTVKDAVAVKDFYVAVCGWTARNHDMEAYADFDILTSDGEVVAGICHARDDNADTPPVWMNYVEVASLEQSLAEVTARGGAIVQDRRFLGSGWMAVIRDPAGAHLALWETRGAS